MSCLANVGYAQQCRNEEVRFVFLSNIPKDYHASDLRNFFSQFIEPRKITCFHFRHRPEIQASHANSVKSSELLECVRSRRRDPSRLCCFLTLKNEYVASFLNTYHLAHWLNVKDEIPLSDQCVLRSIEFDREPDMQDILQFLEFRPPKWMPQGNVGTPTEHFFKLIKNCELERSAISKLKLNFNARSKARKYGAVPYKYDSYCEITPSGLFPEPGEIRSCNGTRILNNSEFEESRTLGLFEVQASSDVSPEVHPDTESPETEDDEPCEDWERFEALHDDPYKVNRDDKANIKYEDKIELVWEKGGSGLVFHTDERTWRKMDPLRKEEFFDEPASFDWDIDMEMYENPSVLSVGPTPTGHWGSARDTADLIDMNREKGSLEDSSITSPPEAPQCSKFGTEGFGSHFMRKMGWTPGGRLGAPTSAVSCSFGLIDPLNGSGSLPPRVRTGLGYYGRRITRRNETSALTEQSKRSLSEKESSPRTVYIRSVFDSPKIVATRTGTDLTSNPLYRNDPRLTMKYRESKSSLSDPSRNLISKTLPAIQHNRTVILTPHGAVSKQGITFVPGGWLFPRRTC
ncbi:unnamed protein product [Calicophoron daubneyi]|uniref:G-patch domain-containing protein n=1 Tax=Calicophoron daubneyi TaxID=300641 RepID=A0AAV2TZZ1_CALDB